MTPARNEGASDASIAVLTLLAQGDEDSRCGRTLDTATVDDLVRTYLSERRRAQ